MEITVKEMNRVSLMVVSGRVDSSTSAELGKSLTEQLDKNNNRLVVDLADVAYISSAGLRELVTALKRAKTDGGDLRLAAPSPRVLEVLGMAGLDSIFDVYDDQVEAVGSF